ncbi:MAG: glycoside hydrolase family 3 C-terminal domain-containing protein [Bacillota bacterium]
MKKSHRMLKILGAVLAFFCMIITYAAAENDAAPPYKNPKLPVEDRINDLIPRMTLEEKIDLLGGAGFATKPNARLGIPEMRMTDGPVGVRTNKTTAFPGGITLAATWDIEMARNIGWAIGREVRGVNKHVLLGPCVNIARIPQGGRNFESYGEDPYLASRMTVAYIKGVQSQNVAATVKHYACNNQEYRRDRVDVKVGARALNEIYLPAFKAAVREAGVLAVMGAYNQVNGDYCCQNDYLLTEKLKKEWGFEGLAMSDWGAVHSTVPTTLAGLDLEMPTGGYLNNSLLESVKNGTVPVKIIDGMVRRILRVMFRLGLFEQPGAEHAGNLIACAEHRKIALEAARAGIVLLKNDQNILPLSSSNIKTLAVIGPDAANARTGGGGSAKVDPIYAVSPWQALEERLGAKLNIIYAAGTSGVDFKDNTALLTSLNMSRDKAGAEPGLRGEYFKNRAFEGKPFLSRTDGKISFHEDFGFPHPENGFSARWTGFLHPKKRGEYQFIIDCNHGVRLHINGQPVIDSWPNRGVRTERGVIQLEDKPCSFKLEYFGIGKKSSIKLGWIIPGVSPLENAANIASGADMVLLFLGTSGSWETAESEGHDRDSLYLSKRQTDLIDRITQVNKNVVVIQCSGSPVLMDDWLDKVPAVLQTWFGGSETGNAVADVLFGDYNPSGKLPVTFPRNWEDCSAYGTYRGDGITADYSDGIYVGYRHFDKRGIEPLFPFGYGLSYTAFAYGNLKTSAASKKSEVMVAFELENTGKRKGAEVAQLYVKKIKSAVDRPVQELKRFQKVLLAPGEKKRVELVLVWDDFAYYNEKQKKWAVEPGEYEILVGSSSRDIRLKGKCRL